MRIAIYKLLFRLEPSMNDRTSTVRATIFTLLAATLASGTSPNSWAQAETGTSSATPFALGTIVVTGTAADIDELGAEQAGSVVTREQMLQFNRDNIADALNLLSGITLSQGQKNERRVSIRGFETSKVGLYIDGIPVYIPFDGAVDMNRFTTADLSGIQVAKGFTSMAYGANAMSGVINLITRKPVEAFEGDVAIGFGEGSERQVRLNAGTNQGMWYLQGSVSQLQSDWFRLSSDFEPNPSSTEDGGRRNNSYRKDRKVSFKIGLTPNDTDEYALSYLRQKGEKGQPPSTVVRGGQFWRWPYWNKESIYLNTRTALGGKETLKVRLYHDTFDNAIDMYTDETFTQIRGTGPSIYNDKTIGGSVELESTRVTNNTLRVFAFYKKDIHDKDDYSGAQTAYDRMKDELLSYAIENNHRIRSDLLLSLGVARHRLKPQEIYKSDAPAPGLTLPSAKSAVDVQAGLFYDRSLQARLYATIARKTRLPSLQDRYNAAFGRYVENPHLQPEKSLNYEIGYQGTPWRATKAEAAFFYSEVEDKIQTWYPDPTLPCAAATDPDPNVCQQRNVGKVRYPGIELSLRSQLSSRLELGGNLTYLDPKNISDPQTKVTDVPDRKLTVHTLYHPVETVDIVAFVENSSYRWATNTVKLGDYTTLNVKTAYRPMEAMTLEAGINNATDKNYSFSSGFPQPGRMWFVNTNYRF